MYVVILLSSYLFIIIIIIIILQLVQGSQATVIVPEIPALNGQIPRSWNLSEEGTHLVVGFQSGALQVSFLECIC